jgi:hypothetical protein
MTMTGGPSNPVMNWFKTNPWGKLGVIVFVGLVAVSLGYVGHTSGSAAIDRTHYRTLVDSETGKIYTLKITRGMMIDPAVSPDTGRPTLYTPEECYWNADGSTKIAPTYVILNSLLGKPGPTFCPDCGRLVVLHNPMPNGQPPPTLREYQKLNGVTDGR